MNELIVILALLAFVAWRERAHATERASLLQRIQDPSTAIVSHERQQHPSRPPAQVIAADDDDAYKAQRERRANGGA